jgi:hypothetical protein
MVKNLVIIIYNMGSAFSSSGSIPGKLNKQVVLKQRIDDIVNKLTEEYTSKYLNPNFCNRIALVYRNKLKRFNKIDLEGVSKKLRLSYIADVPQLKDKLCDSIIKHYQDRLNLIAAIRFSLSFCSNRIFALTSGPRCIGQPEIFDMENCKKAGGNWKTTIVAPNHELSENSPWFVHLNSMQTYYLDVLTRLLNILRQLEDYDETINDEKLRTMVPEVERLMDAMKSRCSSLYKLALTSRTVTKQELNHMDENNNIAKQEASAKLAALRASKGLAPVGQS